ncbi:hypothetical protein [Corynebacterium sp.]|uniref:hypothetical protein n=1 Tax=Corynebacterium sp. TaxID=1720 RepID=UPI003B3BCB1F
MHRIKPAEVLDLVEATIGQRKAMLTVKQAAQVSGRHPQTIWKACAAEELASSQDRPHAPIYISALALAQHYDLLGKGAAA